MSKTEVLPVEKLHHRNNALNDLAASCRADRYYGWDVGRPEE